MADSPENRRLHELAALIDSGECRPYSGALKVGVDLGTANIAIVVLDEDNQPVAGVMYPSNVVKDGVVVDYLTASRVVTHLKQILEQKLGCTLDRAATAVPPGISEGNIKVIVNVVESAGFIVTQVLDEPVAAASALNIKNGAVVDVGGGTTGMSILKSGKVTFSADEPTGGNHMTLVIAGALGLSYAEAEEMKKKPAQEAQVFTLVLPVAQKMASLVSGWLATQRVKNIYLVGGASSFSQFANVFSKQTGKNVIPSVEPLLVTPLGIAMNADQG
ncbi:ethanolamine utilization protein EutJ [Escherichia coli]|uniref:Ethanolamine utilization protein EutJ n=1 Tax=Escherichia coli TaxID=562 RepID=A0AAP6AZK3_ECOLX|nr:ethanolamine utilization protein EutJ [Escherichia coli]EED1845368.1 ethanolamine utilization protein EutJ [Escherichia coli]EEZ1594894.1 ethanolamine utilization protein EutJ [Escherichia coli]MCX8308336.1 ethanolamine utilization protein EutJ [Escherichia coli]MCX8329429.1 ethanolamine utilization protein EutJ [Escherichia coli]MCX8334760.1 ethanolamine utilization protein EutJ [Escherichia coli]